jgi:hypothetical protein
MDLIDILRKLRKLTKKFLLKNIEEFEHLLVDSTLKFSMDCDFKASLLLLSSFPQLDYYGAFICSLSYSLKDLEKKICTPIPFYDMRENANKSMESKHPVTYTIHPQNHINEINLNIFGNLQFILSCTRVSSKFKNSLTYSIKNSEEKIDVGKAQGDNHFEEMSCFFGESIQKANKKEILNKKIKKKQQKLARKTPIKSKFEKKIIFVPHFLNKKGELLALNSPFEESSKALKKMNQAKFEKKELIVPEKLEMEIDSQLDDSGTLLSMVIGEDFSVKMV